MLPLMLHNIIYFVGVHAVRAQPSVNASVVDTACLCFSSASGVHLRARRRSSALMEGGVGKLPGSHGMALGPVNRGLRTVIL